MQNVGGWDVHYKIMYIRIVHIDRRFELIYYFRHFGKFVFILFIFSIIENCNAYFYFFLIIIVTFSAVIIVSNLDGDYAGNKGGKLL